MMSSLDGTGRAPDDETFVTVVLAQVLRIERHGDVEDLGGIETETLESPIPDAVADALADDAREPHDVLARWIVEDRDGRRFAERVADAVTRTRRWNDGDEEG